MQAKHTAAGRPVQRGRYGRGDDAGQTQAGKGISRVQRAFCRTATQFREGAAGRKMEDELQAYLITDWKVGMV